MAQIMYTHKINKAKPKKIYLTAMALLLMFGSVGSPASVAGLQIAQAKTTKVKTKAAGKAKTKSAKLSEDKYGGLQRIRDFNAKYAEKNKPIYQEDKANNASAKLGKDVDGYFTYRKSSETGKFNKKNVTYFGGGKGHWYKYDSDIRFVKDKSNLNSGAGSTGVVYPNIAQYHNVHNRRMTKKDITVRLTWMGGPKEWTTSDMSSIGQKQLSFHTTSVSVSAQGDDSTDTFRVEYFTDTKCTQPLYVAGDNGEVVANGTNGSTLPQAAFTFKDIDQHQFIGMQSAKRGNSYTKAFYDNGNKKGQQTKVAPTNGDEYEKKGNLWTGGLAGDKGRDKAKPGEIDHGSIDSDDPRGFISFISTDKHLYDYGHGSSSTKKSQIVGKVSAGALKTQTGLKQLPKSKDYLAHFGNLWAFGANGNQNIRWTGTATKYVSDKGIEGATPSTEDKLGEPGKHNSDWVRNLLIRGTDKPIYYGIVTNAAWPANYHKGDKVVGINNFGFADNEVSPGLDIKYVKVYRQSKLGAPYYDMSYMFDSTFSNETHKVKSVLKDKYANSKEFFGYRWTVVIKVQPNANLPLNQPITMKDGTKSLGAEITNVAQWTSSLTTKTTDTFHGESIGGSTIQITTTKPSFTKQPEAGTAHKYVFRKDPNSNGAWADSVEQNYDGGTVYPGQELKYQIRVHMGHNTDRNFTNIRLTDNPSGDVHIEEADKVQTKSSASTGETVVFNVRATVNKDAKIGSSIDNTANVSYTRYRVTPGSFVPKDPKHPEKGGHYEADTIDSYDASMSVNTTHNRVIERNIKAPIKTAYAVEDGKLYPLNQFEYNKKFKYVIRQEAGNRYVDTNGDSFEISDDLPDSLKAEGLTAKVYRLTNNSANKAAAGDKKTAGSKEIDVDDDTTYGIDVTNSEGTLKQTGNKFTWTGDTSKMPFKGETYTMVITGTYKSGGDKIEASDDDGGYDLAVKNTAHSKIDGVPSDSNTVTVPVEKAQPSLDKSIVAIHDDTTNEDITDFTQILKPQDNYSITYRFTSFAGNEFDGKSYTLTDKLPDNMKITSIEKPQGSIMTTGGDGTFEKDDSVVANVTTSGTGTDELTIKNSKVKSYGLISVDVKTSVKGQGDWSNYYNRMVYNNGGEDDANNKATDSSYMQIPNEANETYHDSDSINAHNSSGIDFNMGVQTLKVKQYIAQDDSKWTDDLKSSHYLPVSDGKADNSNKAVTTMLVIYAPNYLKNQKVAITTQADNSKVDGSNFNSGGFERGTSAFNLMNNDKAIEYKNDAKKLDFDNLNLKPAIDKANQTTSETVDTKDLAQPGQTYTYEQKYSPTTKFAKEFAKLDHMHGTFSSKVKFSDTTENNDDYFKDINKVGIKLSNIYGYTTRMSKGEYSQDGKTVDFKVYGEQIGLAVDNDNKTNFTDDTAKFDLPNNADGKTKLADFDNASTAKNYTDSATAERIGGYDESAEKQPVAVWLMPQNGTEAPGKDSDLLHTIRLKSNVGQGESVKIGTDPEKDNTNFKNIDATTFWKSKNSANKDYSYVGFSSGSARTMTKGHSVVIATTDPQDKNKEDTLGASRVTQLKYEPYVQHIFTADGNIDRDKQKNSRDIATDFVKPNTVATNPAQFVTYYDSNALPEKTITDATPAAQRVLREAYWLTAPKSMSAKASYGVEIPYHLHSFTFGKTPDDKTLTSLYQTNLQSKDAIFDAGNTKTANDERLGFSYDATQNIDSIKKTLDDNTLENKTSLEKLLDAIDPKTNKTVAEDDKWLNILPDYNLIDISYRFNNRVLDRGKQAYAKDDVMYSDYNKNLLGYTYGSDLVKGGFRNYLRDDLDLTNYPLNLYSSTGNRGLIDFPGFGIGYATSFDFTQNLSIYGTRMATKNDHDSKDSDIIVQPAISGRNADKHNDLGDKGNEWLKHNDADSLNKNSSKASILTR